MRSRPSTLALAVTVLSLGGLAGCPSGALAAGSLAFLPCPRSQEFSCSTLPVPLDRSGTIPGTISLDVERRLAGGAPSRDAVVALAGGPGQAAIPLAEFIAQAIAPALTSRDLLVFDQRGTGTSGPLGCEVDEATARTEGQLYEQCALSIGPARADFTTEESVQDIEALRKAGGYEKLVLYGTSYGTKVALEYAERYPQNVEALVLDSVVPSDGPEPFQVPSFKAIAGVLAELCAANACRGVTANPVADLARLVAGLQRRALSGSVWNGHGKRQRATLTEVGLFDIILAGDLNPALRALLPAAVVSALHADPDPLLRLDALSEGLIPTLPSGSHGEEEGGINEALFFTTSCEEDPFPWSRSAGFSTRESEALAALHALPAGTFYPFNTATAFLAGLIPECLNWPDAASPPPPPSPLPAVPTLILSGLQDLRTPSSGARAIAGEIPGSTLVTVPYTGHSVLGSDLSGCASKAVSAFFAGTPVAACAANVRDEFAPTPVTPTSLRRIAAPPGLAGRPGRTLVAVLDTLLDFNRQVIGATIEADEELPAGSSFGGLHGGYARLSPSAAVLHHLTFVPGVELTGTFPIHDGVLEPATIRIGGREASSGSVRLGRGLKRASGTLGGRHFSITTAKARLSAATDGQWPTGAALAGLLRGLAGTGAVAPPARIG